MIKSKKIFILAFFSLFMLIIFSAAYLPVSAESLSLPEPIPSDQKDKIKESYKQKQPSLPYGLYNKKKVFYRNESSTALPSGWYYDDEYNNWREMGQQELPKPVSSDQNDSKVTGRWYQPQNDIIFSTIDGKKVFYREPSTAELPAGWYYFDEFNNWQQQREGQASASQSLGPIPISNPGVTREQIIQNIIRTLLIVITAVGLITIIIGGYQYASAGGNPEQATKAKNTILGTIIGLIIAFSAYAIIRYIIEGII